MSLNVFYKALKRKARNEYYVKQKKKNKKKKEEREKQQGKISICHAQKPFCMKEDFTPPKTSQLHHIFGEQKGLLLCRGNMTPNAPIEVPD